MKKIAKIFLCVLFISISMISCSQGNKGGKISNTNKTLIIYYSASGTTEKVAKELQRKTKGDIYFIKTNAPYSTDQEVLGKEMALERENGNIRELSGELPNLSNYDLILIGGPVWSGKPSNPIQKYLSMTDFSGKKVAGFWTAFGEPGDYANEFKKLVKNAELHEGLSLINTDISNEKELDSKINTWLSTLGIL